MVDRLQSMTKLAGKGKSSCAPARIGSGFKRTALCTVEFMIGTLRRSQRPPTCRPLLLLQWRPLGDRELWQIMEQIAYWGPTPTRATRRATRAAIRSGSRSQLCYSRTGSSDRVYCLPCRYQHGGAADVLGQTDLDGGWPALLRTTGRRKLLSAEVM